MQKNVVIFLQSRESLWYQEWVEVKLVEYSESPFMSPKGRRREDKRGRILDAAVIEIARSGYQNTTVARIARRAGVADGTIYLYFENKEAILAAVFDRAMDHFIAEGILEISPGEDACVRLEEIVRLHLELVGQDHDLAVILQVELRHSLHFMDMFSRNRLRIYLGILASLIEHGRASGVFRTTLEPMEAAKMVFGVLDQAVTDWILADDNSRLSARGDGVCTFIMAALGGTYRTGPG